MIIVNRPGRMVKFEDEEPKKMPSDSEVSKEEIEAQKQMLMSTIKNIGNGSKSILEKQKKKA